MKEPYLIGIAGGSASGKTSFLRSLLDHFSSTELSLVSQDNYYRPEIEQPTDPQGKRNFDLPESIDRSGFAKDIETLRSGKPIERLEYTFNNPKATPEIIRIEPAPVIISEGLFIFHYEEVHQMLDYRVFLHADAEVRLQRRIHRDHKERGYPEHEVRYQWENHVRPADRQFLEPHREQCHLVIDNNVRFDDGLSKLKQHIEKVLSK